MAFSMFTSAVVVVFRPTETSGGHDDDDVNSPVGWVCIVGGGAVDLQGRHHIFLYGAPLYKV